jgi:hypothetical protein
LFVNRITLKVESERSKISNDVDDDDDDFATHCGDLLFLPVTDGDLGRIDSKKGKEALS